MNLCMLAHSPSPHTRKWANYFAQRGHVVHLLSFQQAEIQNVREHKLEPILPGKVGYLTALPQVKRLLREIRPDILHAHYATSFGLLGALSGFHPYVISVWGSDVFAFPGKSLIHKRLLEFNLSRADHICSTSQVLASEVKKYTTRAVTVTPFGIDCQVFRPLSPRDRNADEFVVGTVKGLDPVYGIQHLLRGFALLVQRHPQKRLRLVIAGEGRLKDHLVKLAEELGIANATQFLGFVPHHQVPELLNTFSVFVVASEWESFGVAALEASACGVPVVVSNVGGLVEVVRDGVTGLLVPPRNPEAIAASLSKLISDEQLRHEMGTAGREFVLKNYEWNETAGRMEQLYQSLLQGGRRVC